MCYVFIGEEMRRGVERDLKNPFIGRGKDGRILCLLCTISVIKNK